MSFYKRRLDILLVEFMPYGLAGSHAGFSSYLPDGRRKSRLLNADSTIKSSEAGGQKPSVGVNKFYSFQLRISSYFQNG